MALVLHGHFGEYSLEVVVDRAHRSPANNTARTRIFLVTESSVATSLPFLLIHCQLRWSPAVRVPVPLAYFSSAWVDGILQGPAWAHRIFT
jgi:hypothetical protein